MDLVGERWGALALPWLSTPSMLPSEGGCGRSGLRGTEGEPSGHQRRIQRKLL